MLQLQADYLSGTTQEPITADPAAAKLHSGLVERGKANVPTVAFAANRVTEDIIPFRTYGRELRWQQAARVFDVQLYARHAA